MITEEKRNKIISQGLNEIQNCLTLKKRRVYRRWQQSDALLYLVNEINEGNKIATNGKDGTLEWVAPNINTGEAAGFIQTFLSKIDSPNTFDIKPVDASDRISARYLTAIKEQDEHNDRWFKKLRVNKGSALKYGVMINEYVSTNMPHYRGFLTPISPYNFCIDTTVNALNYRNAMYAGADGTYVTTAELKRNRKMYNKKYVDLLLGQSYETSTSYSDVEQLKQVKYQGMDTDENMKSTYSSKENVRFWKWFTTCEGKMYYMLLHRDTGIAVQMFEWKKPLPYWCSFTDPDMDDFWCLSPLDYAIGIFLAENIAVNAMFENFVKRNNPMKYVMGVNSVVDENELQYSPNALVRLKGDKSIQETIQFQETPGMEEAMLLQDKLRNIVSLDSGVGPSSQGDAPATKATIYKGNMSNLADRFALSDRNLSDGYLDFADLWYQGVISNMTEEFAIEYIGLDGTETSEIIGKADITPSRGRYNFRLSSSTAENTMDVEAKQDKLKALTDFFDKIPNQNYALETIFETVGLDKNTISSLMSKQTGLTGDIMAQALNDIEMVMLGKDIEPRIEVSPAYVSVISEFMHSPQARTKSKKQLEKLKAYFDIVVEQAKENLARNEFIGQASPPVDEQQQEVTEQPQPMEAQQPQ